FSTVTATPATYTLSLHDALPISPAPSAPPDPGRKPGEHGGLDLFSLLAEHEHEQVSVYYDPSTGYRGIIAIHSTVLGPALGGTRDRKSTRLNSSHVAISYAVFCL